MSRLAERGSASILALAVGMMILLLGLGLAGVGGAVASRHAAESAADLAALAGAGRIGVGQDACEVAGRIAQANGAQLSDCVLRSAADGRSGDVLVTVRRSWRGLGFEASVWATARAARLP